MSTKRYRLHAIAALSTALSLVLVTPAQAATVTSSGDAFVDPNNAATNFGANANLIATNGGCPGVAIGQVGYIQFTGFDSGGSGFSINLGLNLNPSPDVNIPVYLIPVGNGFTESTITYNNQTAQTGFNPASITTQAQLQSAAVANATVTGGTGSTISFSGSALSAAFVGKTTATFAIAIGCAPSNTAVPSQVVFASREASNAALRPQLTYTPASTSAATTTTITATPNPTASGQNVTLTALVNGGAAGTPTGTVTFFNGTNSLGTATLANGQAVLNTSFTNTGSTPLTLQVTATYSPASGSTFTASTSAAVVQTVNGIAVAPTATATPTPVIPELPPLWLFASGLVILGFVGGRARRQRR